MGHSEYSHRAGRTGAFLLRQVPGELLEERLRAFEHGRRRRRCGSARKNARRRVGKFPDSPGGPRRTCRYARRVSGATWLYVPAWAAVEIVKATCETSTSQLQCASSRRSAVKRRLSRPSRA